MLQVQYSDEVTVWPGHPNMIRNRGRETCGTTDSRFTKQHKLNDVFAKILVLNLDIFSRVREHTDAGFSSEENGSTAHAIKVSSFYFLFFYNIFFYM
jgi:hypothetical protein